MFTIYQDPADYFGFVIVRGFEIDGGGEPLPDLTPLYVGHSIAEARRALPNDATTLIRRDKNDHPSVIETWF